MINEDKNEFVPVVPGDEEEVEITEKDFEFAVRDNKSHEQKFETKPTTFLKDSIKRFSKNKSSVVATYILGALILLAIFVPVFSQSVIDKPSPDMIYLEPKLFPAGTGFWDGVKHYEGIAYDKEAGTPDQEGFSKNAIMPGTLKVGEIEHVNAYNKFAWGGNVRYVIKDYAQGKKTYMESYPMHQKFNTSTNHQDNMIITFGDEFDAGYQGASYRIYIKWFEENTGYTNMLPLTEWSKDYTTQTLDLTKLVKQKTDEAKAAGTLEKYGQTYSKAQFGIELDSTNKPTNGNKECVMIQSVKLETIDNNNEKYVEEFAVRSFDDANAFVNITPKTPDNKGDDERYWRSTGEKLLYKANMQKCSFNYDTYAGVFGLKRMTINGSDMDKYIENGWVEFDYKNDVASFRLTELGEEESPVREIHEVKKVDGPITVYSFDCEVIYYKYIGFDSMPIFLFGTDKSGKDMFKYVFDGLRTSLLLGVLTFIVNFLFGLLWGSISGYFGGNVDLAMERFTDILNGVPWIVVMTLCIIHLGSNFATFALALCLTGWIGTAALTRTQFYRFKGREYVLASRTLGSSDFRLIFKHILPNAMGTIITSAVLMIPSVIFSEATISYLGLGLQNMSSLGVILSTNQGQLTSHPYLLIFPSVVIALIMISFNLFGNGLRDAINPSLKGEGE